MKIALLGAGYAAKTLYVKAAKSLSLQVTGVFDRLAQSGMEVADELGCVFYSEYDKMLDQSGADTIIIATSTNTHLPFIEIAADKGIKHIFCEKPAGINLDEATKIAKICHDNDITLKVGYKMRYEPIFSKIKDLLLQNRIGDVQEITLNFYQTLPHSEWFFDHGVLSETLVHIIDLSNWFVGVEPLEIECTKGYRLGYKAEDSASVFINYDGNIRANIAGGWIQDYPFISGRKNILIHIVGTGGYISGIRPDRLLVCDEEGQSVIEIGQGDSIELELLEFIDICQGDVSKNYGAGIDDAIKVHKILEASNQSASVKRR